jgi:hypothetical protein
MSQLNDCYQLIDNLNEEVAKLKKALKNSQRLSGPIVKVMADHMDKLEKYLDTISAELQDYDQYTCEHCGGQVIHDGDGCHCDGCGYVFMGGCGCH